MKRELDGLCGQETLLPNMVVGVFLAREGANILAANKLGFHPLSLHPPDLLQLVTRYSTTTTDTRSNTELSLSPSVTVYIHACVCE